MNERSIGDALARRFCVLAAPLLALAACSTVNLPDAPKTIRQAANPHYKIGAPYKIDGRWYVPKVDETYDETGVASWYGDAFHGKLTANGAGPNAVDFYKKLSPGYEEVYVRYYAKYEANVEWHHTGVWVGGYNPASNWPSPQAGLKPNGDDRFHVSLEPMEGNTATPRMDFYNYWMKMHSWMDNPQGNTAYYGNSLIHDPGLTAKEQWQCFELHIKLNTGASSGAGAELGVWVNDQSVIQFTDSTPLGYWVKDKFCPDNATGTECTNYKPANPTLVPLDFQVRSTLNLKINAFWPQNYITSGGAGSVWYDDMVIAKSRVGCIQ